MAYPKASVGRLGTVPEGVGSGGARIEINMDNRDFQLWSDAARPISRPSGFYARDRIILIQQYRLSVHDPLGLDTDLAARAVVLMLGESPSLRYCCRQVLLDQRYPLIRAK